MDLNPYYNIVEDSADKLPNVLRTNTSLKLRVTPFEDLNIVKFYGLSEVDGKVVMIFEWAEMGNLKEIQLAFFTTIFEHNDVTLYGTQTRKFYFAARHNDNEKSITISQSIDVVNWMSPEKICKLFTESENSNQIPYSQKEEIFSIPKNSLLNMKSNDIVIHVTRGNREICDNFLDPEIKLFMKAF
ncbi:hypothetical protein C2G38_2242312 [Gigaspora rosea]|uniref:Uncharacterized protein n=1 Tax=Gigaspora rosea TaxID=44941 RepID=A0A397VY99_9GLOM|nr:hypothetical protein C2G38_2242312 [Gigaspora rosea]